MPGGRPTDYKEEFCEKIIEFGKQGMSKHEMCLELDICHQTMTNWSEKHPEFLAAIKTAVSFSQGWWEREGRKATFNSEGFNPTSFIFNMKNRFREDYTDTIRQEISNPAPLVITFNNDIPNEKTNDSV